MIRRGRRFFFCVLQGLSGDGRHIRLMLGRRGQYGHCSAWLYWASCWLLPSRSRPGTKWSQCEYGQWNRPSNSFCMNRFGPLSSSRPIISSPAASWPAHAGHEWRTSSVLRLPQEERCHPPAAVLYILHTVPHIHCSMHTYLRIHPYTYW